MANERFVQSTRSLRDRILTGALWSLAGSGAYHGLSFASTIICARFLGNAGFGELMMVRNTVAMLGMIAGMGLGVTATRYVAEFRSSDPERAGRILRLCGLTAWISGIVATLALVMLAPYVSRTALANSGLAVPLAIGSVLLFAYAVDGAQKGVLAGFEAYPTIALINLCGGLTTFPIVLAGVAYAGVNGALSALALSAILMLVLNRYAIGRQCVAHGIPVPARHWWDERRILVRFSLPALLLKIVAPPAVWACNAMLAHQPNGYTELGLVGAAEQLRMLALFVPAAVFQCLMPILSAELNRDSSSSRSHRLHVINAYGSFFLATAIVALLLFFVNPLLNLFGKTFVDGRMVLVLSLLYLPVSTFKDGIGRLIHAKELLWYGVASSILLSVILLTAAYGLIQFGAAGLAAAHLLAITLNSAVVVPFYYAKLKMSRAIVRDIKLGVLLYGALAPGVVAALCELFAWQKGLLFAVTVALLGTAAWVIGRWLRVSTILPGGLSPRA